MDNVAKVRTFIDLKREFLDPLQTALKGKVPVNFSLKLGLSVDKVTFQLENAIRAQYVQDQISTLELSAELLDIVPALDNLRQQLAVVFTTMERYSDGMGRYVHGYENWAHIEQFLKNNGIAFWGYQFFGGHPYLAPDVHELEA